MNRQCWREYAVEFHLNEYCVVGRIDNNIVYFVRCGDDVAAAFRLRDTRRKEELGHD